MTKNQESKKGVKTIEAIRDLFRKMKNLPILQRREKFKKFGTQTTENRVIEQQFGIL